MKTVYFLADATAATVITPKSIGDIRFVIDGPRMPFSLVNETNGMLIRYTGTVTADERLWIETARQICFRRRKRAPKGSIVISSQDQVHIAPHQAGWGWMRLATGLNVLKIVAGV